MSKRKILLASVLFVLLLMFNFVGVSAQINTEELPQEEYDELFKTFEEDIVLLTEEPRQREFESFDANENGLFVIGYSSSATSIIDRYDYACVYNIEGVFQYAYRFNSVGSFYCEIDNYNNFILYEVRGNIMCTVNPRGEIVDIRRVSAEDLNWRVLEEEGFEIVGDITYTFKNNTIFDFIDDNYSSISVKDSSENENVIFDVSGYYIAKTLIIFCAINAFVIFVISTAIIYFIKQRRNNY
jgi:hypothetical protein